jgi:hypothetical protein
MTATAAFTEIAEARHRFTESFFYALQDKAGSYESLLALTAGQPRGRVEAIIDELMPLSALEKTARQFLLDKEELFDGLEAQPWGVES